MNDKFPHGCDDDHFNELAAEAEHAAHEEGECQRGCPWCEAEVQADLEAEYGDNFWKQWSDK